MTLSSQYLIEQSLLQTKLQRRLDLQLSLHGISFTEYLIMHRLHEAVQHTMRRIELAESVGISASGVTRLLAPMEKNKLVEKRANARDARVSLVKLSKVGIVLYQDATTSFEHCAQALTSKLSAKQLENLIKLQAQL